MPDSRIRRRTKKALYLLEKPFLLRSLKTQMQDPLPIGGADQQLSAEELARTEKNYLRVIREYAQDKKRFLMSAEVISTFYRCSMRLTSRRFGAGEVDPREVVVVCVVKNDRLRIEALLTHYRRLGILHFLILDQGSSDGTAEFLAEQTDVNLFFCGGSFNAQKKDGWIGRMLRTIGRNRWYLIVDSDEMVDYIGSEEHSLAELAEALSRRGARRGKGILADMYPEGSVARHLEQAAELAKTYRLFDTDSYRLLDEGEFVPHMMGGPRPRVTGIMNEWASKSPLFYFGEDDEVINPHFQFPVEKDLKAPWIFMIRHYKFYVPDRELFIRKEEQKFMQEFKNWIISDSAEGTDFQYPGSAEYRDSSSIKKLSFIEKLF